MDGITVGALEGLSSTAYSSRPCLGKGRAVTDADENEANQPDTAHTDLQASLRRVIRERDAIQEELDQLKARLTEANFRSMNAKDGGLELEIETSREWMLVVAEHLVALLETSAGTNYVEWDIKPSGQIDPYRLVLVRPGGKSPHELRQAAEAERDTALAQLAEEREARRVAEIQGRDLFLACARHMAERDAALAEVAVLEAKIKSEFD